MSKPCAKNSSLDVSEMWSFFDVLLVYIFVFVKLGRSTNSLTIKSMLS